MKKTLLSIFTVAAAFAANAQCTPDNVWLAQFAGGKLLPDTLTFNNTWNYNSVIGQDYSATFNLKTITDTTASGQDVKILKIKYIGMDGAPAGTTVTTDQADSTWENAGTFPNLTAVSGCASVFVPASSLMNAGEVFSLTLKVDLLLNVFGSEIWYSDLTPPLGTGDYLLYAGYKLKNTQHVGVADIDVSEAGLVVYPNPFSDNAEVKFTLANNSKVTLAVSDITGKVVRNANLEGKAGINDYSFVKGNLQSGIYFLTLTSGEKTITKKFSIQ